MVNILKLKGKIVEKGFNVERLAKSTEVSKHVLYQRLKKSEDFTVKEVVAIANVLDLNSEELNDIFFSNIIA